MTSMNVHSCTLYEKVGPHQWVSNFCMHYPTVHMAFRLYLDIVFGLLHLFMCQTVPCQACSMLFQRLSHKSLHYRGQLEVPIWYLLDILGRKVRSRQNGSSRPQMIPALHHEWAGIPRKDLRTSFRLMRRGCTACVRSDKSHTYYLTYCDI